MLVERLTRLGVPLLAAAALGFGLATTLLLTPRDAVTATPNPPPVASLGAEMVAGLGEVQPAGEAIDVAAPLSGVVREVHVASGDLVQAGQPLFALDDRELHAELELRESALAVDEARLARLRAGTRPEDLPPARAAVAGARVAAARARDGWQRAERLGKSGAIAEEERQGRRFAYDQATAELARVEGELARLEAGTWALDIEIAEKQAAQGRAAVERVRTDLERSVVRAPLDGRVLRVDVRVGEYAHAGTGAVAPVVLGPAGTMQVRVQVDEEDASRVRAGARAEGFVRGRERARIDLRFLRIEPRVVPKLSLTGATTERIDTRVLFIVYEIVGDPQRVYAGQKLDVFIDAA